jgi:hypothetical protein
MADDYLLEVLRSVKVPPPLVNSQAFVDYLKAQAAADTKPQTPDEAFRRLNELVALMVASHLDLINVVGAFDAQLRAVGERLRTIAKPEE